MFQKFKKVFSFKVSKITDDQKNSDLISQINDILNIDDLDNLLTLPESSLLLLNVYHRSFIIFLNNMLQKSVQLNIISVNVHEYFKGNRENIRNHFERIIPIVEKNELNIKIKEELTEIVNMISFLDGLRNGK